MLQDLDKSIATLLKSQLPATIASAATITFSVPDDTFPTSSVKLPAIDLFLFAIEENKELRTREPFLDRQADGSVTERPAQPRVDVHYMISAFPAAGTSSPSDDEHQMLGEVMRVLFRYRRLPDSVLQGSMVGQFTSVKALSAVSGGNMRQAGVELWQALKTRPRATLHYVITICVDTGIAGEPQPMVTSAQIVGKS